jgi:DNA-binding protein HU-beta
VIDTLFSAEAGIIPGVLKSGEKVQITGFGVFEPRKRKAREGYNPRTGKRMGIKESTSAVFRVGKGLRESLT